MGPSSVINPSFRACRRPLIPGKPHKLNPNVLFLKGDGLDFATQKAPLLVAFDFHLSADVPPEQHIGNRDVCHSRFPRMYIATIPSWQGSPGCNQPDNCLLILYKYKHVNLIKLAKIPF